MYYTTTEVAKLMNVSTATVVRMIDRNELEAVRFGHQYRIPKRVIDQITGIRASA